jgi:hypothetical protein
MNKQVGTDLHAEHESWPPLQTFNLFKTRVVTVDSIMRVW